MVGFVNKFMTNVFRDSNFTAVQINLCLLKLLLQYHNPELSQFLEKSFVTTEMYAIPWIVTLLATRCASVEINLELWDRLAEQNEPKFTLFLLVAFI